MKESKNGVKKIHVKQKHSGKDITKSTQRKLKQEKKQIGKKENFWKLSSVALFMPVLRRATEDAYDMGFRHGKRAGKRVVWFFILGTILGIILANIFFL